MKNKELIHLTLDEFKQIDLPANHIFKNISIESIWYLLEECPLLHLKTGKKLIKKGQQNQTMYLLMDGKLSIHLESADAEPVAFLSNGQTVGEISVIDDSPATAFVLAAESSKVLAINEDIFWLLVELSHDFATNMLLLLAQRMRENTSRVTEGRIRKKQLEIETTVDILTNLRNRRWLDKNLTRMVNRHHFGDNPLCVLMIDIDHFKKFNDDHGHASGDKVLASVAKVVIDKLRPTDHAARYGGEEFVVILPETDLKGAKIAAERLRKSVSELKVAKDEKNYLPQITISLGTALLKEKEPPEELLARADAALYKAKDNGRNRVELST